MPRLHRGRASRTTPRRSPNSPERYSSFRGAASVPGWPRPTGDTGREFSGSSAISVAAFICKAASACECKSTALPAREQATARLFIIGDHCSEGGILFGNEALIPPCLHSRGRRIGDIGPRQRSGGKPDGITQQRTPGQSGHACFLPHSCRTLGRVLVVFRQAL